MDGDHHAAADAMTFQAPIFNSGLFGKANEFVCNAWTEASRSVSASAEGIEWAQRQVAKSDLPDRWLAKVTAASSAGTNKWTYTFEPFVIDSGGAPASVSGTWGTGTGAINIRELRNSGSEIDGSPIPAGASIGPFGSTWSGTAWSTTSLSGYTEMHSDYRSDGSVLFWFDGINPTRCG